AGTMCESVWSGIEGGIARSYGHCMTMGTASTMTAFAEALGMTLPGASSIPAPDSSHQRMAAASGRRAVEMVWEDLTPDKILTREAFDHATMVQMAVGGSTNAIIHAIAMAGGAGIDYGLDEFDAMSRRIPVIANIRPSGSTYLMEDFFYAGALRAVLNRLIPHFHADAITVTGKPIIETARDAGIYNDDVIR